MELSKLLDNIYEAKNESELFDGICSLENFIEKNNKKVFFEEKMSSNNGKFLILKNDYTIHHIFKIFENRYFIKSVLDILKYQRDYKELNLAPQKILSDGYFINLFLNCSFYFVSLFSGDLKQKNIDYIGKSFWAAVKRIEGKFSYEFSRIDILNAFESLIFDRQYFFQKDFPLYINSENFYFNFKKARLIIGNYLVDFSIPILLSNSFKKIVSIKKKTGDKFSVKDSINRLNSVLKKYEFLRGGFKFDDLGINNNDQISAFEYYFKVRESTKILLLINSVVGGLNEFSHNEILTKINSSGDTLNKIKDFFYKNYNIFPDYTGPKNTTGQWGNKSFLNTIKFFTLLDVVKKSNDVQWKIDVFLKHITYWIDDLHDNINYFSELDDYEDIKNDLISGESDATEFKSTFGLPVEGYENENQFNAIKRDIVGQIAKTILAMANSNGGNIFIGVVEKINKIDESIKSHIVERNGMYFLDIQFSLKEEKEEFDSKRLLLQQLLKNLTKERLDFLDSLFTFHFYKIYIENKGSCIEILKINVKKSENTIFMKKDENWITLPKRLNGRVELIDPTDEFLKK
jgi:hypothetical protein